MHIPLTEDDVVATLHLDLVAVLGVEQHLIAGFHGTHVRTDGDDRCPHQSLAHLRGGRDEDATGGTTLAIVAAEMHEHAIVEHLDREAISIDRKAVGEGGRRVVHGTTVPSPIVSHDSTTTELRLHAADGPELEAESCVPSNARAAVVLCHPHPQHGGSMRSIVTSELFRVLPTAGLAVLRFNFRGVEGSTGTHGAGVGERNDIVAAIDAMSDALPDLPLFVSGWSFGGDTSLTVVDDRIDAWLPCAPPLRIVPLEEITAAAGVDPRPKVLIVPEHDSFRDPASAIEATADWLATEVLTIAGADHFFVGRTDRVATLLIDSIDRLIGRAG